MSRAADRTITLSIEGAAGLWPEPPEWFSFSSIQDAETCPRRWGLSRASYPGLWEGTGYPDRPHLAAMIGDVVHDSLETIIVTLTKSGCASTQDEEAVAVLRSLGGCSAVIRKSANRKMRRLENNPRCAGRLEQLRRDLTRKLPDMRQTIQSLLSRSSFVPQRREAGSSTGATTSDLTAAARKVLPNGSYPEMALRSTRLRMAGRADLVVLSDSAVHIVDYKTGAPSEHHAEQLRFYALLWSLRDDPDPSRPYATRLTLSYPNQDVTVEAPAVDELAVIEAQTVARIDELINQLGENPPQARPDEETCRFCSVRHLCDPFWRSLADSPLPEGFGDLRGEVVQANGPRSWRLRLGSGEEVLLRVTDESIQYRPTTWLRILGAVVSHGSDATPAIVSLVATSEVFTERHPAGATPGGP